MCFLANKKILYTPKLPNSTYIILANTYLFHYPPKIANTYLYTYPSFSSVSTSDMDTSSTSAMRSIQAGLSAQYDERVASTLEKVDPNQAKARAMLAEDDHIEAEDLTCEWDGYKEPLPQGPQSYLEAPLLTLRDLMPGTTAEDDDPDLDLSFRADKVEFIVTQRALTHPEIEVDQVLKDPADVDWEIPTQPEYEDIMGTALDVYTDERPELVLCGCSNGSWLFFSQDGPS